MDRGLIKQLRKEAGLTQKKLAEMIGRTESFISYVEAGKRELSPKDVRKVNLVLRSKGLKLPIAKSINEKLDLIIDLLTRIAR